MAGRPMARLARAALDRGGTRGVHYSLNVPTFAEYADPRVVAGLARDAEQAGWDGLLVWDHLVVDRDWTLHIGVPPGGAGRKR
jgi:alkanesulfonate monooxygenase SsuD/methylene tetrahydromethanopterin reductase-like flavin-dependent oxidoreductase (luciferase family)